MSKLRVLIACEFSGIVRDAFAALGHDAWSCDFLPSERPGNHIQGDVLTQLEYHSPGNLGTEGWREGTRWDLLIAHPPCTYLCNSGVRWLAPGGKLPKTEPGVISSRHGQMMDACDFFAALYHAPIARVCVENPVMHKYARDYLQSAWKVPAHSMTCQPYEHGHAETKRHCFWLRGLPLLVPSKVIAPDFDKHPSGVQTRRKDGAVVQQRGSGYCARVHHASPGPNRWKERSRTLPGIAKALAEQYGAIL